MGILTKSLSAVTRLLKSPQAVLYLLLAIAAVILETREELLSNTHLKECSGPGPTAMLYQRYATAEFRKPRTHYVRLIVLSENNVPAEVWANACPRREYIATILRKLAALAPAAIALDFDFRRDACKDNCAMAEDLRQAVKEVSQTIPVIIAEREISVDEMSQKDAEELKAKGFSSRDLILPLHDRFDGEWLTFGLARLACETRAAPLFWRVHGGKVAPREKSSIQPGSPADPDAYECGPAGAERAATVKGPDGEPPGAPQMEPHWEPTFAYQTARIYDFHLESVLRQFASQNRAAFVSFIPENDFDHIAPSTLSENAPTNELQSRLRGKIALIAQRSNSDVFEDTPLGETYGYVLHANYIEALLDDRYFRPINAWVELMLTILGILIILLMFELAEEFKGVAPWLRPLFGFGVALVFVAIVFVCCSAFLTYFGRELGFWTILVLVPFIELIFTYRALARPKRAADADGRTIQKSLGDPQE
jgi:CHASE2 domain-containing sensor protein